MGYPAWYERISSPFRSGAAVRVVNVIDRGLVYLIAACYVITLIVMAIAGDGRLLRMLLVPAIAFALVTVMRIFVNAPRPYELYGIDPIIVKDTKGKSFPSRHVASAVVISVAFLYLNPLAGCVALLASAVVSLTRIVGGVHFPRDVVAAIVIAGLCGAVGFFVIP